MLDIGHIQAAYAQLVEANFIPKGCLVVSLAGMGWYNPTTWPWYYELLTPATMRQGIYHANDNQF
jgi:hypothetical protein